jgi:hypothetical protein
VIPAEGISERDILASVDAPAASKTPGTKREGAASPPPRPEPSSPILQSSGSRNEALVSALKNIVGLTKKGQVDDAYREYAKLFAGALFSDARPEDQRQALKLMTAGKLQQPSGEPVRDAYRAALVRALDLARRAGDPADYEIVGLCHYALDEKDPAREAWKKALDIERGKNSQPELAARVNKHLVAAGGS